MKIGYFDCISGISGDMVLGALVDAGVPLEQMDEAVRSIGVPGLKLESEKVHRHAFYATKINVIAPPEHVHRHLKDILEMIERSILPAEAVKLASDIFERIAIAEAKVHGTTIEDVHFHEVGAADSIADICGFAFGLHFLDLDAFYSSPVPTGSGTIKIAHGNCTVPAPATAELLTGIPISPSNVQFELTTPTGAAILATIVKKFGPLPGVSIERIGYGAGGKDLEEQPNILRLIIGEMHEEGTGHDHSQEHEHDHPHVHHRHHTHDEKEPAYSRSGVLLLWMLETNLDDVNGEWIGYAISKLWELEPLDVFTESITMKKQRPGIKLSVLCQKEQIAEIERIIFRETGTLGIRRYPVERTELPRTPRTIKTEYGEVKAKQAVLPDGAVRITPEYESAAEIAARHDVPIRIVYDALRRAVTEEEKNSFPSPIETNWND